MTRDATIWKEAAEVIASHHSAVDAIAECLERAKSAAPVAAEPPSLVALADVLRIFNTWRRDLPTDRGFNHSEGLDFHQRITALLAWTPAQAEPGKVCGAPTPDRSGRSCDKPKGHDGDHWTYGGHTLTWPAQAEPAAPDDWQPIETAPKDSAVMLWIPRRFPCVVVGSFWETDDSQWGWWACSQLVEPTHWMQLPSEPAALPASSPAAPEMPEIQAGDEITHVDEATVFAIVDTLIETSDGGGIALEDVTAIRRNGVVIWSRP